MTPVIRIARRIRGVGEIAGRGAGQAIGDDACSDHHVVRETIAVRNDGFLATGWRLGRQEIRSSDCFRGEACTVSAATHSTCVVGVPHVAGLIQKGLFNVVQLDFEPSPGIRHVTLSSQEVLARKRLGRDARYFCA